MNFFSLFPKVGKELIQKKILFFYSALMIAFLYGINLIGKNFVVSIQKAWIFKLWVIGINTFLLLFLTFIFTEMIGITLFKKGKFLGYGKRFFLRSLFILIIIIILSQVIPIIVGGYIAAFLGSKISLSTNIARMIFLLLYVLWILFFLIFFTFSNFFCLKNNIGIKESIKKSFSFVKKNYIKTLLSMTIFYLLWQILGLIPEYGGIIASFILTPFLVVWLAELVKKDHEYNL